MNNKNLSKKEIGKNFFHNIDEEESNKKQQILIAVEYKDSKNNQESNEKKVKNIVNDIKDNSKIGEFILNDIKKQGESFKERLLQRRKKNNLESKPNSNDKNKDNDKDKEQEKINEKLENNEHDNKIIYIDKKDSAIVKKLFENEETNNKIQNSSEVNDLNNINNTEFSSNLNNENEKNTNGSKIIRIMDSLEFDNNVNNFDEANTNEENIDNNKIASDNKKIVNNFSEINCKNNDSDDKEKDKQVIFEMKNKKFAQILDIISVNLEQNPKEFRENFFSNVIHRLLENIERINFEKINKYTDICRIYNSQIKEMEFLINEDDQHAESISCILDSLKEEKQQELDRMESHYMNLIDDSIQNFKQFGIKNNSSIQLLEEKLKLDIVSQINKSMIPTNFSN